MSKTVKRAMRVMMIGLVAMLGANAEAHYIYVFGKYKYCSICLDHGTDDQGMPIPTLQEVPSVPDPNDPTKFLPAPGEVEVRVKAKLIQIECPQPPVVIKKVSETLVAETRSNDWTYDAVTGTAFVSVRVDDDSLNTVCPGSGEVKILKMSATANSYVCDPLSDPNNPDCSDNTKVLASIMKLNNCTLPSDAHFDDPYDCTPPDIQHVN